MLASTFLFQLSQAVLSAFDKTLSSFQKSMNKVIFKKKWHSPLFPVKNCIFTPLPPQIFSLKLWAFRLSNCIYLRNKII
jgi:hypothetical protein